MICTRCKKEIDDDSKYCKYCGELIREEKREHIKINVKDLVNGRDYFINIFKDSTYKELLTYIYSKRFLRFSKKSYETIKIYSEDGSICFRDNELKFADKRFDGEILDDYFVDGCVCLLYYEEEERVDMRGIVCLYGCPSSKNCNLNLESKEGNL